MKKKKHLIIAGGTGFLGTLLANYFCNRYERVTLLTRHARPQQGNIHYAEWDGKQPGPWVSLIDGSDGLINLTGKSVYCRYTEANRQAIVESRINSTLALGAACIMAKEAPPLWINSSSATIYRDAYDRAQDEETGQLGDDFSPTVCKQWEETFFSIPLPQTRKVAFRTALVLGENGGAYPLFRTLTRLGLGGKAGSGNQMVSWIHALDFIRSIEYALDKAHVEGIYNCCAPEPLSNKDFMRSLRRELRIPIGLPSTRGMLHLASVLIGTESELLLKSRWVIPHRLQNEGFTFRYATLSDALKNLAHHDIQPVSAVRLETAL